MYGVQAGVREVATEPVGCFDAVFPLHQILVQSLIGHWFVMMMMMMMLMMMMMISTATLHVIKIQNLRLVSGDWFSKQLF